MTQNNSEYDDEEDSQLLARLYPKPQKPQPFDPSPCRRDDCALVAAAMRLQPDRQSMTIAAAKQILDMQKDRERRAEAAAAARARYAKKKATRKPTRKAS